MQPQTQNASKVPSSLPQAQTLSKEDLVLRIKRFISGCKLVCTNSHSDFYHSIEKGRHWDMVSELSKMLAHNAEHSKQGIKNFTLLVQRDLHGILPHADNTSYKTRLNELTQIIELCKK